MTTISSDTSVHNVRTIKAASSYTMGMPLRLTLESHTGLPSYVTIFVNDEGYVRRLVDAINSAAEAPAEDHDADFQAAVEASAAYFNRYAAEKR